jgi:hypothetical protein
VTELGMQIDFNDAFIAYLNGREVARSGVTRSSGRNAQGVKVRDAKGGLYFIVSDPQKHLKDGANILAIEAHNATADDMEFLLAPNLIVED